MLLKCRAENDELLIMRYLNNRMELSEKEKFYYLTLEKGYEGEVKFDELTETLQEERYIINDLLLEVNNSYFQIDSTIISQGVIYLLDIKNFEGDYYLENDKFYNMTSGREYKNPVDQLKRSANLFRQLLQNLKQNYLVEALVIFINPEFTLYQAPKDQPIILPTQVKRFIKDLNKTDSKLNDEHKNVAQSLLTLHKPKSPFSALPEYKYDQIRKGIYCKMCKSFLISIKNSDAVCEKCGGSESIEAAILRNAKEFTHLFPERRITSQSIYEWCKVDLNIKTIRRILKKNFKAFGTTSDTYYK